MDFSFPTAPNPTPPHPPENVSKRARVHKTPPPKIKKTQKTFSKNGHAARARTQVQNSFECRLLFTAFKNLIFFDQQNYHEKGHCCEADAA
jgi:hypothetical protein